MDWNVLSLFMPMVTVNCWWHLQNHLQPSFINKSISSPDILSLLWSIEVFFLVIIKTSRFLGLDNSLICVSSNHHHHHHPHLIPSIKLIIFSPTPSPPHHHNNHHRLGDLQGNHCNFPPPSHHHHPPPHHPPPPHHHPPHGQHNLPNEPKHEGLKHAVENKQLKHIKG